MSDVAQLGIRVTTDGIDRANREMETLSGAAARAQAGTDGLANASRGATGAASAAAKAYGTQGSAAASASRQIELMNRAANQNSSALGGLSSQLRMATMQFSQIGQQVQAGTSLLQALAIQLPDLALGFGPIGILAGVAAGAVLTYLSHWLNEGEAANLTIAEQSKLISDIAGSWGDAIPAIQAYAAELDRVNIARDAAAATEIISAAKTAESARVVDELQVQLVSLQSDLRELGNNSRIIQDLTDSFQTLRDRVASGQSTQEDFNAVLKAAEAASGTGVLGLDVFIQRVQALAGIAVGVTKDLAAMNAQISAATNAALNDPRTWRSGSPFYVGNPDGPMQGSSDPDLPFNGPTPGGRPLIELEGLPKTRGAGGRVANDNYKSSILSIQERTKAIQAETAAQAALNPLVNDYGFAITKARTSADLLAAAERAKKDITPGLIAQIDETSTALARATAEQNKQADAVNKYKATIDFLKSTTAGFLNDLRDGLRDGEGFWQALGDAATGVLDRITDKLLNETLDAVFKVNSAASGEGASGGGILGSIFGSLFGGGSGAFPSKPGVGLYAAGTPAARPGLAWVGEKGPELVRFKGGEEVIPNHRILPAANQNNASTRSQPSDQPRELVLRVIGEEGPMFRPTIRAESQDIAVTVVQESNKARENLYQNGEAH